MKKNQIGGYLLEYTILKLLKKLNYINVVQKELKGRGSYHQIDAVGIFNVPSPFIYPIRLICEAKYHKVKLPEIRNFLGVIKDISENYFIKSNNNKRYNDIGCFFSLKSFSPKAQNYAWAQNIFLVSLAGCEYFNPFVREINNYLSLLNENSYLTKKDHIRNFSSRETFKKVIKDNAIIVASLNKSYPVMLTCENSLLNNFKKAAKESVSDFLIAEKTERSDSENGLYTIFKLSVIDGHAQLSVPRHIAEKIIIKINNSSMGQNIFNLDIPIVISGKNLKRRIFKVKVILG